MLNDSPSRLFTEKVVEATAQDVDARSKQVIAALIRHMHEFVLEVGLTLDELTNACSFMVRAGKISEKGRDEFILMANILGLEVLVDMISPDGGEQTAILGPMYLPTAPSLPAGASIVKADIVGGETAFVEGFVYDLAGKPVAGASLDVWQASLNGLYDVQDSEQPDGNLRGIFTTDETGYYAFRCVRPTPYPIPDDGPGGELLRLLKRHPMRPAHLHFIVRAPGKHSIISQLFDASCPYIETDSIFAVKDTLILDFEPARGRADTDLYVRRDWALADEGDRNPS